MKKVVVSATDDGPFRIGEVGPLPSGWSLEHAARDTGSGSTVLELKFKVPNDPGPNRVTLRIEILRDVDALLTGGVGAFPMAYVIRPGDFTDGLSQTAFMSEKRLGGARPSTYDPGRDHWCLGIVTKPFPSTGDLIASCEKVPSPSPPFCDDNGGSWYTCGHDTTWYNHTVTPNSRVPGCKLDPCPRPALSSTSGGIFGASSLHPGGVNVALGDGSVRFVKETVDLRAWRAMSTRANGEIFSSDTD